MKPALCILCALWLAPAGMAQNLSEKSLPVDYRSLDIRGPVRVELRVADGEGLPAIAIDYKGCDPAKLGYKEVNGELRIRLGQQRDRTERPVVRITYKVLGALSLDGAEAWFVSPVRQPAVECTLRGGAVLKAEVECTELRLDVAGNSTVDVCGRARYLVLDAVGSKVDLRPVNALSVEVSAVQGAEVYVEAKERLVGRASMGGALFYKGTPEVLRLKQSLMGTANDIGR